MNVGDLVTIKGRIVEVIANEDYGTRVSVKFKANDKSAILTFEEDEVAPYSTSNSGAEEP